MLYVYCICPDWVNRVRIWFKKTSLPAYSKRETPCHPVIKNSSKTPSKIRKNIYANRSPKTKLTDTREGAAIGAIGGALTGFVSGSCMGVAYALGTKISNQGNYAVASIVANAVVTGLIGYGIANAAGVTVITVGAAAASFAVGGAISAGASLCCNLVCAPKTEANA